MVILSASRRLVRCGFLLPYDVCETLQCGGQTHTGLITLLHGACAYSSVLSHA